MQDDILVLDTRAQKMAKRMLACSISGYYQEAEKYRKKLGSLLSSAGLRSEYDANNIDTQDNLLRLWGKTTETFLEFLDMDYLPGKEEEELYNNARIALEEDQRALRLEYEW